MATCSKKPNFDARAPGDFPPAPPEGGARGEVVGVAEVVPPFLRGDVTICCSSALSFSTGPPPTLPPPPPPPPPPLGALAPSPPPWPWLEVLVCNRTPASTSSRDLGCEAAIFSSNNFRLLRALPGVTTSTALVIGGGTRPRGEMGAPPSSRATTDGDLPCRTSASTSSRDFGCEAAILSSKSFL